MEKPKRIRERKGEKISPVLIEEHIIPERYRENFELKEFWCDGKFWIARLEEKEERVPEGLKGKEAVLNGFLKKVEVADFPFKGIPVIFEFYRRRWKEKGAGSGGESYQNSYILHKEGMKCTEEFGDFLKGFPREVSHQYLVFLGIDGFE